MTCIVVFLSCLPLASAVRASIEELDALYKRPAPCHPASAWQVVQSEHEDTAGQYYYWNEGTDETTWDRPDACDAAAEKKKPPERPPPPFGGIPQPGATDPLNCVGAEIELAPNHANLNLALAGFICDKGTSICVSAAKGGCAGVTTGSYCREVERKECCSGKANIFLRQGNMAYFRCTGKDLSEQCYKTSGGKNGKTYKPFRAAALGDMCGWHDGARLKCRKGKGKKSFKNKAGGTCQPKA